VYDVPPSPEDLLRDAARNHQLERAYNVEQAEKKSKRRDEQFELHEKLAEQFLTDPTMRALEHPKPTHRQCYLQRGRRQILFDARIGHGLARQVPPEAYRRFTADLRERRERNMARRAEQLALHEEKRRAIADWVERCGTSDQKARHAAGLLPLQEALEGLADEVFAVVGDRPRYVRDGVERLQAHLRQFPDYANVVISPLELLVGSTQAESVYCGTVGSQTTSGDDPAERATLVSSSSPVVEDGPESTGINPVRRPRHRQVRSVHLETRVPGPHLGEVVSHSQHRKQRRPPHTYCPRASGVL
jgi:hypothetical protein